MFTGQRHEPSTVSLVMAPDLDADGERQQLEDRRAELDAARQRYHSRRDPELKADYLRLLKAFTDLVLREERPTSP